MKDLVSKETVEPCRWEVKRENLVSNKLARLKFPPSRDNEADVSSVRPSSSLSD